MAASAKVLDGGPAPAMTLGNPVSRKFRTAVKNPGLATASVLASVLCGAAAPPNTPAARLEAIETQYPP